MYGYYDDKLSAERLKRVYELATPAVRRYLEAEVEFARARVRPGDAVLELGCGYGRILPRLADKAEFVIGIDTSLPSLRSGAGGLADTGNIHLVNANALHLPFQDGAFEVVVCVQNGISAFHVNRRSLIAEAFRVTKPDGTALFSSYSAGFWKDRLRWFELQASAGLLGEIDYERTGDGVIVCKDGFVAATVGPDEFKTLTRDLDAEVYITEVDASSVFSVIVRNLR